MASGAWVIPDLAKLNFFNATDLLGANTANFRAALVSSAWTPNNATDELWAVASGSEIANGNGYTTGGVALTSVALTQTAGVVKFTAANPAWTATGAGFPAFRRIVVYYLGTLNGKVNPLVCHSLGDSTPADVPATTTANSPLTISIAANGIIGAT